ncbi:glycosyltransferase family 39 protein, partial [Candidatus Sumerlaeota bacterium]|nr:glycosyltransferase family 39 protein [Candidatus Sumerlaeota bacterium]
MQPPHAPDTARGTDGLKVETPGRSVNAHLSRRRRWTDRRVWALLTVAYLALWVSLFQVYDGGRFIDPFNHIIYLTSLLHDRDLDFADDIVAANTFERQRLQQLGRLSPEGMVRNNWPPGAALLWAPVSVPFHFASHLLADWTGQEPPVRFGFPPMAALSLTTAICGYLALWLLYRLARLQARPGPAGAAAAVALLCSPLPFHALRLPASNHALTTFAVAWWLWLAAHAWGRHPMRRGLWLGLAGGIMVLVRWQSAVFGIAGIAVLLPRVMALMRRQPRLALTSLGLAALGFLSVFGIQLIIWRTIEGSWLPNPYGEGYMHWTDPAVLALLFSGKGGIFHWNPALALGFIGLVPLAIRRPWLAGGLIVSGLIHLHIIAAVDDWHGEWGIGNRRLCALLPMLVLGMAEVFRQVRGRSVIALLAVLIAALAVGNWLLMLWGYRGPVGIFSPFNQAGWSTLIHFAGPLAEVIAAHPAIALIDNTFFAPWLEFHRAAALAHFGIIAAFFPVFVLIIGRRLMNSRLLLRITGPTLVAALLAVQIFLLFGLKPPPLGVAETGAMAQRLQGADAATAREVALSAEGAVGEYLGTPAVYHRLRGISHHARALMYEQRSALNDTVHVYTALRNGAPLEKWELAGWIAPGNLIGITPGGRRQPIAISDHGAVER